MTTTTGTIDLTDLDLFVDGDPHAAWRWLRENAPVYWNETPAGGFWALTRHQDVHDAYVDSRTFSSAKGTVMGGSHRSESDTASGEMLICSDPPKHRLLRQQVHKAFATRMMEHAATRVTEYLGPALDRSLADGGCDFATDVARELPAGFLAAMFGLDRDEAGRLLDLTQRMIGHQDGHLGHAGSELELVATQVEIFDMMAELLEQRRRRPTEDLPSLLSSSTINGRPMSDDQILYNCLNVAVGGNETTPYTASAAVDTFIKHPSEVDRLYADWSLLPTAVEEVFRWTSTNAYVQRHATRDVEVGGVPIAAGDSVTLWNSSANRDAARFPAPDRFDVGRDPNHHLTFGIGAHRCIGQAAAQLEISLLLEQFVDRRLRFEPVSEPRRLRSNFMLGITSQPVHVTAG
jgi:cytochrome P450